MDIFAWLRRRGPEPEPVSAIATSSRTDPPFAVMAGMTDIFKDTEDFRQDSNYDTIFDLYDSMLKFDPELNGAVRTISLTANNYSIDYKKAKNADIRNAVRELVEENVDFDDLLINAMRNLMVYGNDINKLVGRTGQGILAVQSLPISQITITDNRKIPFAASKDNPIMFADEYIFREQKIDTQTFPASEILHIRIDYRSYWFQDKLSRWSYGVWGASRFSSLKQAIRAKYNSMNNRIALEDSMTKQYITIGPEAVEHVSDPAEQKERLETIMKKVGDLLDTLRADQVPILPSYVQMHHVDLKNTIPDNSGFLDQVNGDISSVLHVPRVSMGQEKGSTFAATFNANTWSVQAIRRLQHVLTESIKRLFSKHLSLLGIEHKQKDLPPLVFGPVDEESPSSLMQRAATGYTTGILTLNQSLNIIGLPKDKDGDGRNGSPANLGDQPRENEVVIEKDDKKL
jgi:hypothetical protein